MRKPSVRPAVAIAALATVLALAGCQRGHHGSHYGGYGKGGMHNLASALSFSDLDADRDGMISEDEFKAAPEKIFARQDANGNGRLSQAEVAAFLRRTANDQAQAIISRMDEDEDGSLSLEESSHRRWSDRTIGRVFSRVDADDSGGISREEFEASREHVRK